MRTIEELSTQLEELEKRLKMVTTSQSVLSLLNNINVYINNIQAYLSDLNDNYDAHLINYQTLSDLVAEIEERVKTLEENGGGSSSESNADLSEITSSLEQLETRLNTLIGYSTSTIPMLENDISLLQTEIGIMEDDISEVNTNISSINSSIGEQQTTITNLQSTQTSMSSAQTSLSNTVSGLNTRLTQAEANISSLTGGVDLSELNNRLDEVEESCDKIGAVVTHVNFPLFLQCIPSKYPEIYSLEYSYKTQNDEYVYQAFELNYTFTQSETATNTMTIELLQNGVTSQSHVIDLTKNPTTFKTTDLIIPTDTSQTFQFKITSDVDVIFSNLKVTMIGKNIQIFEYDKPIKVQCFNDKVTLSKYSGPYLYYKTYPKDQFTLDESIDTMSSNKATKSRKSLFFNCIGVSNDKIAHTYNAVIYESVLDEIIVGVSYNSNGNFYHNYSHNTLDKAKVFFNYSTHESGYAPHVKDDGKIYLFKTLNENDTTYEIKLSNSDIQNKWYFANFVTENNYVVGQDATRPIATTNIIAYNEDGNLYLLSGYPNATVTKIGMGGSYANAYYQTDSSINVYVSRNNKTYKYTLTKNEETGEFSSTLVQVIKNCDCYYEILNQKAVIHNTLTNAWEIVDIT